MAIGTAEPLRSEHGTVTSRHVRVAASSRTPEWDDRVCGSLLRAACGDALGAPFEGQARVDASRVHDWSLAAATLTYTDDTAMQRVLRRHLAVAGDCDQERLAQEFAAAWRAEPGRGYGSGPPAIFRTVLAGDDWRGVAGGLFDGAGSLGNGGAMRVAPAAFVPGSLDRRVEVARSQAAVTHAHPQALDGAGVLCAGIALAAEGPFSTEQFLDDVGRHVRTREFGAALQSARELLRGDAAPREVAAVLGCDISAVGSVPAALVFFLRTPRDPVEAILAAVLAGGDTDTIAAMTGALAGAHCGEGAIPQRWRTRLEAADEQRREALALIGSS